MSEKLACEACGELFDAEDKVVVEFSENEMIICQDRKTETDDTWDE